MDGTIRVATYNIRKCIGLDRRRRPERIIEAITGLEAEVVALQEADKRLGRRPAALRAELVTRHTDLVPARLPDAGPSIGWHGNAILVHRRHRIRAVTPLSLPALEPRGALVADISVDGDDARPMRVVAVHLGLTRQHRQRQLHAIMAAIGAMAPRPTVILGDFNEWSARKGLDPIRPDFVVHAPGRSYHAARPVAALDRIAHCHRMTLRDAGVTETPLTRIASDHLPVWADLEVDWRRAPETRAAAASGVSR
ncbi:MAG: metal-dependent hydrolase [Alphaproteobacteria bacterium]|nr:MAG: metal-dependent hydrolase [Alphaproteobacteria bacterium]